MRPHKRGLPMKLWLKVSLLSLIMVTIAISVCSLIMLIRSGQSNLDLAVQNTLTDQQVRAASWSTAMSSELDKQYSNTARRSLARYLIDKFADEKTILLAGGDTVYNCTAIEPAAYLPITADTRQYIIAEIGGRSILIVGSRMNIENTDYLLYVVHDVTSVYTGIEQMAYQFALINLAVVVLCGAVLMVLVRLVLKPIGTLNKNAGHIADGVYDKRIEIHEYDEVGALALSFNRMADAVETRVQELHDEAERRTILMSALTHELKTPMTGISGNAQTLLGTVMTDEEREDALLRIDAECNRVERLSQKMMQLIVLRNHDELPLVPYSVQKLLDGVATSCAEQVKQRGLFLTVDCEIDTLPMETDLLTSMLLNFIDNAGKASKRGGVIELRASGNAISVTDHGKGIPRDEIDKITQPFYMVDKSRAKKAGSIGLGLALCDEIARLHHAHLEIESELENGTTVKVVFDFCCVNRSGVC